MTEKEAPLSRFEKENRAQVRRRLMEHPEVLPELIARHYTSLATTALQLRSLIEARRHGAGGCDEAIAYYVAQLERRHIEDFGAAPSWQSNA